MEIENSSIANELFALTVEQIIMLRFSDHDIAAGRLISQEDLDKNDREWLEGKPNFLTRAKRS